jgi:hypothetical protein
VVGLLLELAAITAAVIVAAAPIKATINVCHLFRPRKKVGRRAMGRLLTKVPSRVESDEASLAR